MNQPDQSPTINSDSENDIKQFSSSRIEELRRSLLDKDREVVKKSAHTLYLAAKEESANALLIVHNPRAIDALVTAMIASGREPIDNDLLKSTLGTLYSISYSKEGSEAILSCTEATPHLVSFLSADFGPKVTMHHYIVCILHNLLWYCPYAWIRIRPDDVVPSYVRLLERYNNETSLAAVFCGLNILGNKYPGMKPLMITNNAHIQFIRILDSPSCEKLLWLASHWIAYLCDFQHNNRPAVIRRAVIKAGAIPALTKHLPSPLLSSADRLVLMSLCALRNLSSVASFAKDLDPLLDRLIEYLGIDDRVVLDHCLNTLYNLTCKSSRNKKYVCAKMGIEALMRVLYEHERIPSIADNTMAVLRNLTNGWMRTDIQTHRGAEIRTSRDKLRQLGCPQLIGRYLLDLKQFPHRVASEALLLLRNLASDGGAWWDEFRQLGIVEVVASMTRLVHSRLLDPLVPNKRPYMLLLARALVVLSVLCQCEENRRVLSASLNGCLANMANEVINNPSLQRLKELASKFVAALSAPIRVQAAAP